MPAEGNKKYQAKDDFQKLYAVLTKVKACQPFLDHYKPFSDDAVKNIEAFTDFSDNPAVLMSFCL